MGLKKYLSRYNTSDSEKMSLVTLDSITHEMLDFVGHVFIL